MSRPRGNFGARPNTRVPHDYSTTPADLTLEQYRRVDPYVVANLVREFGEEAALRILNGKRHEPPAPVPFDRSLLAPPGAVALPGAHRWAKRSRLIAEEL